MLSSYIQEERTALDTGTECMMEDIEGIQYIFTFISTFLIRAELELRLGYQQPNGRSGRMAQRQGAE